MILCGIGESVVNTLLAVLNLPTISQLPLKEEKEKQDWHLKQLRMRPVMKHVEGELLIVLTIL